MVLGPRRHSAPGDDTIKSNVICAGERRYYLDLKQNSRGRFLKVTTIFFIKLWLLLVIVSNKPTETLH